MSAQPGHSPDPHMSFCSDSQSESEASPVKRPRLVENTERPEESSRSKQKSRRRCFQCQTKLELVQQELGSCRCGECPPPGTGLIPSVSGTLSPLTHGCSPSKTLERSSQTRVCGARVSCRLSSLRRALMCVSPRPVSHGVGRQFPCVEHHLSPPLLSTGPPLRTAH